MVRLMADRQGVDRHALRSNVKAVKLLRFARVSFVAATGPRAKAEPCLQATGGLVAVGFRHPPKAKSPARRESAGLAS
jgi:hypothetical protein